MDQIHKHFSDEQRVLDLTREGAIDLYQQGSQRYIANHRFYRHMFRL